MSDNKCNSCEYSIDVSIFPKLAETYPLECSNCTGFNRYVPRRGPLPSPAEPYSIPRTPQESVDFLSTKTEPQQAVDFLAAADNTMRQRGKTYDSPEGERSMGKAVASFNIITGRDLTEAEGWLLMQQVKDVRQWSRKDYHPDSALDGVAFSALKAEALAAGK